MGREVRFYRDVLGMELLCGGEEAGFSSLRAKDMQSAVLNLEEGDTVTGCGRLIFYVADVDAFWIYLKEFQAAIIGRHKRVYITSRF